jgi:signal transduction histidine kinase
MKKAELSQDEGDRISALEEYGILDSLPEKAFDDITKIASQICQTPISLISLIDDKRQWFKSHYGLEATETPRDVAFCAHAINNKNQPFIVPDSRIDKRFSDNPLVTGDPHVIFYTGVPLVSPEGFALGTLCVIDHEPKVLSISQLESLEALGSQVIRLFELRKNNIQLNKLQFDLTEKNKELERFAHIVSHDIKSPLANIISFTELLKMEHSQQLDEEGIQIIDYIGLSAKQLRTFVDGLLSFYRGDQIAFEKVNELNFTAFIQDLIGMLELPKQNCIFNYPLNSIRIKTSEIALKQIFMNLLTNAIKYNNKDEIIIDIVVSEDANYYHFSISDNGIGIDKENQEKIFVLFKHLDTRDRFGNYGTGIGLATVKKIVEKNGGSIKIDSVKNEGTTFEFSFKKTLDGQSVVQV